MYVLVFLALEQCVHFLCASYSQLVQTIIDQCHLSPLPLSVQPINWQLDYTLRLYPMPTTVLILLFSYPSGFEVRSRLATSLLYFIFVASSYWQIATSGTNSRMKAATSSILETSSGMISGSRRISLTVAAQKLRKSLRHLFVQQRSEVLMRCWVS